MVRATHHAGGGFERFRSACATAGVLLLALALAIAVRALASFLPPPVHAFLPPPLFPPLAGGRLNSSPLCVGSRVWAHNPFVFCSRA